MTHVSRARIRLLIVGCCVLLTAPTQVANATEEDEAPTAASRPLDGHHRVLCYRAPGDNCISAASR
jgi:hypothetical protein